MIDQERKRQKFKLLRTMAKKSREDFAPMVGISQRTLEEVERGVRPVRDVFIMGAAWAALANNDELSFDSVRKAVEE